MVQKFGEIEELFIYYHPITNKHLGIGRVIFESTKSAKSCVEKLNTTSVMGKILKVFLDPFGGECKVKFEELTVEKKPVVEEKPPKPLPKIEEKIEEEKKPVVEKSFVKETEEIRPPLPKDTRERERYGRGYVQGRGDFPTPSGSDMGYSTAASEYSTSYGSTNTTPISYDFQHNIPPIPQYPHYGTYHHSIGAAPPVWPVTPQQWPSEPWTKTPTPTPQKWPTNDPAAKIPPPVHHDKKEVKESSKEAKIKERDKNKKNQTKSKKKERPKTAEETKTLDLDTRIELLLKGKGPGGVAPPFLALGVDSDDDGKSPHKNFGIPTSIDSDDGTFLFYEFCVEIS